MGRNLLIFFLVILLEGCSWLELVRDRSLPRSLGEMNSGYTYVPVDPFSVEISPGQGCEAPLSQHDDEGDLDRLGSNTYKFGSLLKSLPDNAVRMSVERFDKSGSVSYGPAGIGYRDESYRVTVDYINADTTNRTFYIAKYMRELGTNEEVWVDLVDTNTDLYVPGTETYDVRTEPPSPDSTYSSQFSEYNIPVYVGIGLRVTADVQVVGGTVNISGLGTIGAEAEADNLNGSLVVQTLGINGKSISAALPIQSELNRTTAQNAVVAVGSIKALLYEDETVVSPRVVGIYLPFPGGKAVVNQIISELSRARVVWERPCRA